MCGLLAVMVRKGSNFDPLLCGLSPPVSPRHEMVSQYTLWNLVTALVSFRLQDRNRNNELWASFIAASRTPPWGIGVYPESEKIRKSLGYFSVHALPRDNGLSPLPYQDNVFARPAAIHAQPPAIV
jgi:hypothetical protein